MHVDASLPQTAKGRFTKGISGRLLALPSLTGRRGRDCSNRELGASGSACYSNLDCALN